MEQANERAERENGTAIPNPRLLIPVPLQVWGALKRNHMHSPYFSYQDHLLVYLELMNELAGEYQMRTQQIHLDKVDPNQKLTITYPFY